MIGVIFGRIVIRPYRVFATNFNLSNSHTIHTVGDGFPVPREAKRLPYNPQQRRTPRGLTMGSLFHRDNNFTMVTIENETSLCYNVMDYTPGGVYVEYY